MADTKISALPVVTTSAAADSIPIVQGGVTSRIHPGPGGGLDAATVSGYGIGVDVSPTTTNLNSLYKGGKYYYANACTGAPPQNTSAGVVEVIGVSSTVSVQIASICPTTNQPRQFFRFLAAGTGTWFEIFNAYSDGNGGQPPAPKPIGTGAPYTVGGLKNTTYTAGQTMYSSGYSDNTKAGNYYYLYLDCISASGIVSGFGSEMYAGSAGLGNVTAGHIVYLTSIRIL